MKTKIVKCGTALSLMIGGLPITSYANSLNNSVENTNTSVVETSRSSTINETEKSESSPNESSSGSSIEQFRNPISTDDDINSWMPDKGLQTAVSTALKISIENLKKTDLEKMVGLDSYGNQISDLKGLEYAKNLRILNLNQQNYIQDISAIEGLTNLQVFNVTGITNVFELAPLANLKELTSVTILSHATQPEQWNTAALENLSNLSSLNLDNVYIKNEKFFSNLTKLDTLSIQHANQPKMINMISGISSLRKINFIGNQIEDLTGIDNLTNLQEIDLSWNYIRDIRLLQNSALPNIQSINLSNQNIGLLLNNETSWTAKDVFEKNEVSANETIPLTPLAGAYTGVYDQEKNGITWSGLGSEMAGEYYSSFNQTIEYQGIKVPYTGVLRGQFVRIKKINFNYFDHDNKIVPSTTESYNLADHAFSPNYDYSDGSHQKELDGYYLDNEKLPQNLKGSIADTKDDGIDINYYYKKIQVMVHYVDESGKELIDSSILEGKRIGETYQSSAKLIDGYTLKEVQGNEKGEFLPEEQTLTYVYKKAPESSKGKVTVNYQDENGKELAPSETLTGEIGESYKTKELKIDGYTLKEVQGNEKGEFLPEEQTLTYVYKKVPESSKGKVTVNYQDENGKELAPSETLTGEIGESYKTKELTIDGYTLKEIKGNATKEFSLEDQKVTYIYEKDPKTSSIPVSRSFGQSQTGSKYPLNSTTSGNAAKNLPSTGEKMNSALPYIGGLLIFAASLWIFRKRKAD